VHFIKQVWKHFPKLFTLSLPYIDHLSLFYILIRAFKAHSNVNVKRHCLKQLLNPEIALALPFSFCYESLFSLLNVGIFYNDVSEEEDAKLYTLT
jgi:hypothetical protein